MTRRAFLEAAATAVDLLADPAVASAWDAPSALREMSVRGLAGHLARQIFHVMRVLAQGRSDEQPITLFEHYVRSDWRDADVDDDANVDIRRDAEREATGGPEALAAQARTTVDDLRRMLLAQPADFVVYLPWGPWALSLDDFLTTRMLEIAIHNDDLAVSVGVETPALPAAVIDLSWACWHAWRCGGTAPRRSCARSVAPSARLRRSRPSDVVCGHGRRVLAAHRPAPPRHQTGPQRRNPAHRSWGQGWNFDQMVGPYVSQCEPHRADRCTYHRAGAVTRTAGRHRSQAYCVPARWAGVAGVLPRRTGAGPIAMVEDCGTARQGRAIHQLRGDEFWDLARS